MTEYIYRCPDGHQIVANTRLVSNAHCRALLPYRWPISGRKSWRKCGKPLRHVKGA
jgi:hypothetical protein